MPRSFFSAPNFPAPKQTARRSAPSTTVYRVLSTVYCYSFYSDRTDTLNRTPTPHLNLPSFQHGTPNPRHSALDKNRAPPKSGSSHPTDGHLRSRDSAKKRGHPEDRRDEGP